MIPLPKKHKCNFHYAVTCMMKSQILKSIDFIKTQNPRYLENETFFIETKKFTKLITYQGLIYGKK